MLINNTSTRGQFYIKVDLSYKCVIACECGVPKYSEVQKDGPEIRPTNGALLFDVAKVETFKGAAAKFAEEVEAAVKKWCKIVRT